MIVIISTPMYLFCRVVNLWPAGRLTRPQADWNWTQRMRDAGGFSSKQLNNKRSTISFQISIRVYLFLEKQESRGPGVFWRNEKILITFVIHTKISLCNFDIFNSLLPHPYSPSIEKCTSFEIALCSFLFRSQPLG